MFFNLSIIILSSFCINNTTLYESDRHRLIQLQSKCNQSSQLQIKFYKIRYQMQSGILMENTNRSNDSQVFENYQKTIKIPIKNKSFSSGKHSRNINQLRSKLASQNNNSNEKVKYFSTSLTVNLCDILTEKDLLKFTLFQSVKKIKGDFYFRNFYQKSKYFQVQGKGTIVQNLLDQKRYFIYILAGQLNLYKVSKETNDNLKVKQNSQWEQVQKYDKKCYLRSYSTHQHLGYQQYPLYIQQKLLAQFSESSKLLLFPLQTFYPTFNNIISLIPIQYTAEFLKKHHLFKQVEMEKLLRLSTFCRRVRTQENFTIRNKAQKLYNLILIYDGRVAVQDLNAMRQERHGFIIGLKEIQNKVDFSIDHYKALNQCDLLIIPIIQFTKISQLKQKLKYNLLEDQRNAKSRRINSNISHYSNQFQDKSFKKYHFSEFKTSQATKFKNSSSLGQFKSKTFMIIQTPSSSTTPKNSNIRAKSAYPIKKNRSLSRTIYDGNGRQFFKPRTTSSIDQSSTRLISDQHSKKIQQKTLENVTMGQMCWDKFIGRKHFIQNRDIQKIIKAKLPDSIINQSRQYALIKPLVNKKSTYVQNYKRKIKISHKNNQRLNTQQVQMTKIEGSSFFVDVRNSINKIKNKQPQLKQKDSIKKAQVNQSIMMKSFIINELQI